ncbi:hypothetical protein Aperf_G00000041581 [Anoplocephala perfoliata]
MAGTRGRPALAHRNICLENIYLRADGVTACIGGLEYGVCALPSPPPLPMEQLLLAYEAHVFEYGLRLNHQDPRATSSSSTPPSADGYHRIPIATAPLFPDWWPVCGLQVGPPVYMAPEILEERMLPFCFESHKRADIYALGIAVWEILAWTLGCGHSQEWIPRDSDVANVKRSVCDEGLRPRLPILRDGADGLMNNEVAEMSIRKRVSGFFDNLLPECWNRESEARLSALRIKKDLAKLHDELFAKNP